MKWLLVICMLYSPMAEHKFYVSLTDMKWNESSKRVEVSSKFFIDDLELALDFGPDKHFTMPMDESLVPELATYIGEHLEIRLDTRLCELSVLGYEIEDDVVWVYQESTPQESFSDVKLQTTLLTDIYPEQQNILHFTKGDELQTLFLRKEKLSGEIHFD